MRNDELCPIQVEEEKCTGCGLCEVACSYQHYGNFGPAFRIEVACDEIAGRFRPAMCRFCVEGKCVDVCPSGAISRRQLKGGQGGIVIDHSLCNGCGACVAECPAGGIRRDSRGEMVVCDLCDGLTRCASVCAPGAIRARE